MKKFIYISFCVYFVFLFSSPGYAEPNYQNIIKAFQTNNIHDYMKQINEIPRNKINYPINRNGQTLLHVVVNSSYRVHLGTIQDSIKLLLKKGANPDAKDNSGRTPLFLINNEKYAVDIIDQLSKTGSDLNATDNNGNTLLHIMAGKSWQDAIDKLLTYKIDVNSKNNQGITPVMLAAKKNKLPIIRKLKNAGADLKIKDDQGNTLLHYAAMSGEISLVDYMQNVGISLDVKNNKEKTAISIFAENKQWAVVRILIKRGANLNVAYKNYVSLGLYLLSDNSTGLTELVSQGVIDPNYVSVKGETPISYALKLMYLKQLEVLFYLGVDLQKTIGRNEYIIPALARLSSTGKNEEVLNLIKLAVKKGANINALGRNQRDTGLITSAWKGYQDRVQLLLELGADVTIVSEDTFINELIRRRLYKIVKLLVDAGIPIDYNNFNLWLKLRQLAKDVEKESTFEKKGEATQLFISIFSRNPVVDLSTVSGSEVIKSRDIISNSSSLVVLNNLAKAKFINESVRSGKKKTAANNRQKINSNTISIPKRKYNVEAKLHVIGVYEGNSNSKSEPWWMKCKSREVSAMAECHKKYAGIHVENQVTVHVLGRDKPVILALMAYEPTLWIIKNPDKIKIEGVILGGYYGQRIRGIDRNTPVDAYTYKSSECTPCQVGDGFFYAYKKGTKNFTRAMNALKQITEKEIESFQGKYRSKMFTVMVK